MMNDDEHDLQRRFDAWSGQERHAAPDFERVWQRAERVAARPVATDGGMRLRLRFAAVAAMVALIAAGVWWGTSDRDESWDAQLAAFEEELDMLPLPEAAPEPREAALPTDFLLAGTGDDKNSNRISR
jgi:hypothetical protein